MSIIPANELTGEILETHTVIIGAGACGLPLAADLTDDLIVVESGAKGIDLQWQNEHRSVVSGEPTNADSVRVRAVGGATVRWTGRCIEMDDYDFQQRPWIAEHGWPIARKELDPWYEQAWNTLEVDRARADQAVDTARLASLFEGEQRLGPCVWRYSYRKRKQYLRFAEVYQDRFRSGNKNLLFAADVVELLTRGSEVVAVRILDRKMRPIVIRAKRFILAAGCIGNIRTLLLTHRKYPAFLGEVEAWLGRGFMQHLRVIAGRVATSPENFRALQRCMNLFPRPNCGFHEVGFGFNPVYAQSEKLGNASMYFNYIPNLAGYSPKRLMTLPAWLFGRRVVFPAGHAELSVDVEQSVSRDSRVTLDPSTDLHGLPRPNVHWTISDNDRRTASRGIEAIANWLDRTGLGALEVSEGLAEGKIPSEYIRDSNHPLGGTRMSESPRDGVVDRNCKVFGTSNLWVLGGSIFSTGGHANPTLTMVALAHRLASHLRSL